MTAELSEDDRGKEVVAGSERVGVVTDVRGEQVYVDPDFETVDDDLAERFDWREGEQNTFPESAVTEVVNAQVRLRADL